MNSSLHQLSSPYCKGSSELLEMLVVEHSFQSLKLFCDRYRNTDDANMGILGTLESALSRGFDFEAAWHPSFGGIHAGLSMPNSELGVRATKLALRLHETGFHGQWKIELPQPERFYFGGWGFEAIGHLNVSASGDLVKITHISHAGESSICFEKMGDNWRATGSVEQLPVLELGNMNWTILNRDYLMVRELEFFRESVEDAGAELMVPRCRTAISVLGENSPEYHFWVTKVIRYIAPRKINRNEHPSGSSSTNLAPSLIGIGNHSQEISLADSLVHEASHHYYYAAMKLGILENGTDKLLYYNPFLKTDRPIGMVLLAYHAFANILLFIRTMRERDPSENEYLIHREKELEAGLPVLERALIETNALTSLGNSMWEPLRDLVHK